MKDDFLDTNDCPRCTPENYKGISRFPIEKAKCPHCSFTYHRQVSSKPKVKLEEAKQWDNRS